MKFEHSHCPTCGAEYKKITPKWVIILAICFALIVGFIVGKPNVSTPSADKPTKVLEIEQQTQSRLALKNYLKDPNSAEIRNHKGACGEVNSKNSFGAYSGYRRFIASPAIVAIEGENMSMDEFGVAWNKLC